MNEILEENSDGLNLILQVKSLSYFTVLKEFSIRKDNAAVVWFHLVLSQYFLNIEDDHGSGLTILCELWTLVKSGSD